MNWIALLVFFALVGAAAFLGGQWGANEWYRTLKKPGFTPPGWLFPIAWSTLYTMIAISGWLVWESEHPLRLAALAIWAGQLAVNASWSYIFFGRKNIGAGLADIALLWALIGSYIAVASQISIAAALLFVPYFIWVSFAAVLNWRILRLNAEG